MAYGDGKLKHADETMYLRVFANNQHWLVCHSRDLPRAFAIFHRKSLRVEPATHYDYVTAPHDSKIY